MNDVPVQVIVAAFNDPEQAGHLMADIKLGKVLGLVGIIDAAVVVKDAEGKLKITDSKRRSTKGFITGGVIGGVLGLLAGPVGWTALGTGAVGALMGKMRGAPLKAEMQDIGSALTPNSSAIVAIIEHTWVAALEEAMAAEGARIVQDALKADIAEQLNAGGSVLYTAGAGGVARLAETPEGAQISGLLVDDEGVFIGDAQFTFEESGEEQADEQE
ncbi:MAG: DUF1269 domain-containing protein [Chloroflexi bacterium]|nr:DUF1269 domain-containing protein [Chloroflexota bacterium]